MTDPIHLRAQPHRRDDPRHGPAALRLPHNASGEARPGLVRGLANAARGHHEAMRRLPHEAGTAHGIEGKGRTGSSGRKIPRRVAGTPSVPVGNLYAASAPQTGVLTCPADRISDAPRHFKEAA